MRLQQGFTLVELAIVMVIVGLLIGGILKGQEMVETARLNSAISQIKSVDAALYTFIEKYNGLPGDMNSPETRLPNCNTAPCNISTAAPNGLIDNGGSILNAPTTATESGRAFVHLAMAGMISGIVPNATTMEFGGNLPKVSVGGGMWLGYHATGAIDTTQHPAGRHYLVLTGTVANVPSSANPGVGAIRAKVAAQMDRKIDDGRPHTGLLQAGGNELRVTNCKNGVTGTAAIYREDQQGGFGCTLYFRVLN